ncbi:MAG: ornithine cyclodeaminase family protein [Proteobacteria bacterium]|nr:ornithine cyclodeaminase family protein [Pseudomonadota bacterium]
MRHISAEEVHAALSYPELISALRDAFVAGAEVPLRSSHSVTPGGDRLLLMPAWNAGGDLGVKLVTVFPRNPERGIPSVSALYVLLDGATGHPRALIDGEALTLRRTAAASALASMYLSRQDASRLLVVGTGALAPYMAAAHCAARPIRKVLVWGRSFERASALAARLSIEGCTVEPVASLAEGLADADIVTCATTARGPVVRAEWVGAGTHVDLVGAFTRGMRECDDALVLRSRVFVDTYAGALKEASDLLDPLEAGLFGREHLLGELADLAAGRHPGRSARDEITLFKSVGSALEDLCAARLVFDRCG